MAGCVVVALASVAVWHRAAPSDKVKLHYRERACMRYRAPADSAAIEFDPEKAKPLVDGAGDYLGGIFYASDGIPAILVPQHLRAYRPQPRWTDATLFLHRRTSAAGTARLVHVTMDSMSIIGREEDGELSSIAVAVSTSRTGRMGSPVNRHGKSHRAANRSSSPGTSSTRTGCPKR